MSAIRIPFIICILATFCVSQIFASENSDTSKQVATIGEFWEVVAADSQPKASDFFRLFGRENESELGLILKQRFPELNIKQTWFSDPEASKYINGVYDNPNQYPSRFIECIRKTRPDLFLGKTKRQIELPPETTRDFKNFKVTTSGKTIIFQFSGQESLIENIYMPDGKSIYTLIEGCGRNP
jgi:hypothetical protein